MKYVSSLSLICLSSILSLATLATGDIPSTSNWPQFRGTAATGVAEGKAPPISWDIEKSKNILWKINVPGLGHSSPVVWGDRVFLTSAVGKAQQELKPGLYGNPQPADDKGELSWKVLCFDKKTGKQLWEQTAHKGLPQIKRHPKGTHANASCCTDGKRVVAFFGSEGLYCYDMDGTPLWDKNFGLLDSGAHNSPDWQWGFASSPVLHDGKLVVLADVQEKQKKSFLALLDAKDGKEIWRTDRHDLPTWGTPTVYAGTGAGDAKIFVNGFKEMAGYDFATGKKLWTLSGAGDVPVPTPIVAHGLVFLTSAHGAQSPVYAVKLDAEGDITPKKGQDASPHIAWQLPMAGNYMQTPLVVGDYLYCCRDNGILACYEAKTGKSVYRQRLQATGYTSSSVAAGDRIYFPSENGAVQVVQAGPEFKLLASSTLGNPCLSSPAISDGVIFFRTSTQLIAIGEKAE